MYGLKPSGASFRALLAEHLHYLGYRPSIVKPDIWMMPAFKSVDFIYYEYVL